MFFDVWANYNVITNAWRKFKSCSRHYKCLGHFSIALQTSSAERSDLTQVWCKLAVYVLGGNLTKMSAFRESLALLWYFLMINFCLARGKVLFMFFNYKESLRTKQWLPIFMTSLFCFVRSFSRRKFEPAIAARLHVTVMSNTNAGRDDEGVGIWVWRRYLWRIKS